MEKQRQKSAYPEKGGNVCSKIFQTTSRYTSSCWGRQVIGEILSILTPEVDRRERSFKTIGGS